MNNKNSRTKNFIKNAFVSLLLQVLLLLLTFISRTVFINILNEDYLGISGLYSNILSVLSLADLGLVTVMIYALYKPISENDQEKIIQLMNYFKKLYQIIAVLIFSLGLLCVPFLQYIVVGSNLELLELRLYFILYLANTVSSYLIVYKSTLINADQRIYILKIIEFSASFLVHLAQIIILYFTHNFSFYLISSVIITLLKNLIITIISNKLYPFLKNKTKALEDSEKKSIIDNVKSLFVYRVSNMVMNSTSNILISVILGTAIVGYYSNYALIITSLSGFITVFVQSMWSSIGNFNEKESSERKLIIFNILVLVFFVIASTCSSVLVAVFNDFIDFWIGGVNKNYILSNFDVWSIVFNFFVTCILNPIWMYRETTGLFKKTRYAMLCAAILNIILAVILGNIVGIGGIILAIPLSKLLTIFWYESKILFNDVFKTKMKSYWIYIIKLTLESAVCIVLMGFINEILPHNFIFIVIKGIIAVAINAIVFILCNYKTKEFTYLKSKGLSLLKKKKIK